MKKILIVDDEEIVRKITELALNYTGEYSVRCCESAALALSEIQYRGVPDLVITDLQMPVMDGLELTKMLKKGIPDLPVVILTGRPDLVPENGLVDMVIEKPYRIEEFLKKIKELI